MEKYWYEEVVDKNGVHTGQFVVYRSASRWTDGVSQQRVRMARCYKETDAELIVRALNNEAPERIAA